MDKSDILNRVHRRMVNDLAGGKGGERSPAAVREIIEKDQQLRKAIAELYFSLEKLSDPKISVELLSDHVAMMVDMINQLKGKA